MFAEDIRIVDKASFDSMDLVELEKFILLVKKERPYLTDLTNEQIYELRNIIHGGKPTLAAVMVFSQFPQAYFPNYTINTIDDIGKRKTNYSKGNIKEMLDDTLAFLYKNMSIEKLYPITVVREMLINALMHRDYSARSEATPIQIILSKSRFEICNPIGLYNRIGGIQPGTRNPNLAAMLEVIKIAENRFSGLATIKKQMEKALLPKPEFIVSKESFKVTLRNPIPSIA